MDNDCCSNEPIRFPCPENGEYTTFNNCVACNKSQNCQIYSFMLDEEFE